MNKIATQFYKNLFDCGEVTSALSVDDFEENTNQPCFIKSEIINAINSLDNGKSSGTDFIKAEALKIASEELAEWLTEIFNNIMRSLHIPKQWKSSMITLIHKRVIKRILVTIDQLASYQLFTRFSPSVYC